MKTKIDLSNRTPKQLKKLLEAVKISDLEYDDKTALIIKIEQKLGIRTYDDVLQDIKNGSADIDDIKL